jgi:hypothetical protein
MIINKRLTAVIIMANGLGLFLYSLSGGANGGAIVPYVGLSDMDRRGV